MSNAEESSSKQFSNWLQSVQSLEDAKASLGQHVLDVWKNRLMEWKKDVRASIPTFLECVANNEIGYRKKKYECVCGHRFCGKILEDLLSIQQNPGPGIVWKSSLCEKIKKGELNFQKSQANGTDNILRVDTTNLNFVWRLLPAFVKLWKTNSKKVSYEDIFHECKEEHVWCIANMFMQRGKAKLNVQNTGPDDTDAAMFFRMMQNCKLFEIDENHLYDDVLMCRNKLHHSANNRIQGKEAVVYLDKITDLLKKFENLKECKDAITKIQKIRDDTVLCISMPDVNIREMAKRVLRLKKNALEVDKEITEDRELIDLYEKTNVEIKTVDDPEKSFDGIVSDDSKDSERHFKERMHLVQTAMDNQQIAPFIKERFNSMLDQIIEDASYRDPDFQKKAKLSMCEGTDHRTSISSDKKKPLRLLHAPTLVTRVSVSHVSTSCVDEVLSEREVDCYITGLCQLPSGEILLVDFSHLRVVKLDTEFQVIAVCSKFSEKPWDVCYNSNNAEAVVSVKRCLTFIDVASMTVTRSVNTEHVCTEVTFHKNLLYVLGVDCIYVYTTEGEKIRVLYADKDIYFFHFAISNDGSVIFITDMTELITIDNSGNRLFRLNDPNFRLLGGVCVDNKGHVLICDRFSCRILQISSDGRNVDGIIAEDILSTTITFDRQRTKVICGGRSNKLSVLKFKESDI